LIYYKSNLSIGCSNAIKISGVSRTLIELPQAGIDMVRYCTSCAGRRFLIDRIVQIGKAEYYH
jgi:hypothetical protein